MSNFWSLNLTSYCFQFASIMLYINGKSLRIDLGCWLMSGILNKFVVERVNAYTLGKRIFSFIIICCIYTYPPDSWDKVVDIKH